MSLTYRETMLVLEMIKFIYGPGYSDHPDIQKIQHKLSVQLAVRIKMGDEMGVVKLPEPKR